MRNRTKKTRINSKKNTNFEENYGKNEDLQVLEQIWHGKRKRINEFKKAVMSVQGDFKDEVIGVEYISKKGKKITTSVKIPMGRKIRQSIALEKKRLARKALLEARQKERYGS